MPIVPSGDVVKSVAVGTPYSPAVSFNPDKKSFYDTHVTTLGVLAYGSGGITSDGVDVTIPSGTKFIYNGIIVELTNSFTVAIPGGGFPKFLMATTDSEVPGSNTTIEFTTNTPPKVLLAQLDPNDTTVVPSPEVSIRGLQQSIDAIVVSGSPWQTTGGVTELVTSGDTVTVGSATNLGKLAVDGDADEIQLVVQGNGTQTSNLITAEQSDGTDVFTLDNDGNGIFLGSVTTGDLNMKSKDGTADWTIKETPTGLIAINNKTGKKYRVPLEEIE